MLSTNAMRYLSFAIKNENCYYELSANIVRIALFNAHVVSYRSLTPGWRNFRIPSVWENDFAKR